MARWTIDIDVYGAERAAEHMEEAAFRAGHLSPAFAAVFRTFEHAERNLFSRLHGHYVDTGRLRGSLVERHHPDAIRRVTPVQIEFGTSVPYAKYQRKGRSRTKGPSAVLVNLTPRQRREASKQILDYIVGR